MYINEHNAVCMFKRMHSNYGTLLFFKVLMQLFAVNKANGLKFRYYDLIAFGLHTHSRPRVHKTQFVNTYIFLCPNHRV